MRKSILFTLLFAAILGFARADGGMWLPLFLNYNEAEMQSLGFRLTAEDVYSVNHHSMKDAVMLFGGGCTGELISNQGLVLTNHHCGYSFVQSHSTMEQNHLQNGFWAKSKDQEIPMEGLTVTFLVYMEDVTVKVLNGVTDKMDEKARKAAIDKNIKQVTAAATEGNGYEATIKPFYYGNQYFMFVTETYSDVRLVGVPPESIGKFGGDSDNWMWPRHTGDFSLWRIYTDKAGKPAAYAPDNIPMVPKKYFPISIKGVDENDFTLVFGYPGTTQQFLTSDGVEVVANVQNPIAIAARTIRLDAMKRQMNLDPRVRLMYSAKANSISNGWKKWQGESKGINECHVIDKKKAQEREFEQWVNTDPKRKRMYGTLLNDMHHLYGTYRNQVKTSTYLGETFIGVELVKFLYTKVLGTASAAEKALQTKDESAFEAARAKLIAAAESFFANYNYNIDEECFTELMHYYFTTQDAQLIPEPLQRYIPQSKEFWKSQFAATYAEYPYFSNGEKFLNVIKTAKAKDFAKMKSTWMMQFILPAFDQYFDNYDALSATKSNLDLYYRQYVDALMKKDTDKTFYPDANLTLRVTYGQVKGFEPADGVQYIHYTTLDGIMEKEDPDIYDYKVDAKLKALWERKDYGRYANKEGKLPVAFIASNHTTGGNSGSPVINANGELIGTNFDRVWEGTMSDIHYDVSRCRNISLDARYFLFIVDKFANAQNLIQEMTIVE